MRYVITDKVHDVWIDDVFYDLAFAARLDGRQGTSTSAEALPPYTATAVGIVSHLEGASSVPNGTPLAEVRIEGEGQPVQLFAPRRSGHGGGRNRDRGSARSAARGPHVERPARRPGLCHAPALGRAAPRFEHLGQRAAL